MLVLRRLIKRDMFLRQFATILGLFFITKIRSATLATKIFKNQWYILFFAHKNADCIGERKTKHYTLLLAFDFIAHQVPDILIECLVLGLPNEANLVWWQMIWIHHTVASGCAYLGEQVTPCSFWCRNGSGAVAVYGCILAGGTLAVVVASAVLFGDFARKVMNRVFVNNLCHMCSAIEPNRPPRRAVRPLCC